MGDLIIIDDTDHHGRDFSKRRITDDCQHIVAMHLRKALVVLSQTCRLLTVTLQLQVGQQIKRHVQIILGRPNLLGIGRTLWRDYQRHSILVIVLREVRSQTNEDGHTVVTQLRATNLVFCVDIHLQTLILAHIQICQLINRTDILRFEAIHLQRHGLLVLLSNLRLARVNLTRNARRQNIIHRCTCTIVFYIHGGNLYRSIPQDTRHCGISQLVVFLVDTPIRTNQGQRTETQVRLILETGHIHTNKTDRTEILDVAHLTIRITYRDLHLIPFYLISTCTRITQIHIRLYHTRDMVLRPILLAEHILVDIHLIDEILLLRIQRTIRVQILGIRISGRRCRIATT